MKKLTAIILALLLACGTMIGCDKETPQNKPAGKETTEQGSKETSPAETEPQMDDVIKDYDREDSQQGFSIKGKKFYYTGNESLDPRSGYSAGDILILNVKNETTTNYTVQLTVSLFDEEGGKIKTETQEFEQFIAGYQNYFLFDSKKPFATYTCDLSLVEYTGEVIVDKLSYDLEGFREVAAPDQEALEQGVQKTTKQNFGRTKLTVQDGYVPTFYGIQMAVVFNKAEEICAIVCTGGRIASGIKEDYSAVPLVIRDEEGVVTPEKFINEYSYIVFPTEVTMGLWAKGTPEYEQAKAQEGD